MHGNNSLSPRAYILNAESMPPVTAKLQSLVTVPQTNLKINVYLHNLESDKSDNFQLYLCTMEKK